MRTLLLLLLLPIASMAAPPYSVNATMPSTTGATGCRLYMNGTLVGTGAAADKACGVVVSYPNLITADGPYTFQFRSFNSIGQSVLLSPVRTINVGTVPADPTVPPAISVVCTPAPCPATVTIVITP